MKYFIIIFFLFCVSTVSAQPKPKHDLTFDSLAKRWDEGIPLGNGWLGALIWQKGDKLRMSLDRVDLWDDRPMPEIDKLKFSWVTEKVKLNQYDSVQKIGDEPYEKYAAPTKIPGAAIEINIASFGKIKTVSLDIKTAITKIEWENGIKMETYVSAISNNGVFVLRNFKGDLDVDIIPPTYNSGKKGSQGNSVEGQGLEKLGYAKGYLIKGKRALQYYQPCYGGMSYVVSVNLMYEKSEVRGHWTILKMNNNIPDQSSKSFDTTKASHIKWWNDYWSRSSVSLPDKLLERQYYLDMYKFGCVTRSNTPPISLQAIWTADNGNLPPWKGDLHHDLNTELSYWPGYTGNHLNLTASFTNWLWKVQEENKKWTKDYFEVEGLNVPGVTTISGKPMGGWIQYSMSPTTAAWLASHFYLQWKYGMDQKFLREKCLPYFDEVENFLMKLRERDLATSKYRMPLSSSPEYFDNSKQAWFSQYTNYDLALTKFLYAKYVEILHANPPRSFKEIFLDSKLYPEFDTNETGLTVAPGQELEESHRHMSPYMAIYPLGLLNIEEPSEKDIINRSLRWIERKGTINWVGYSFAWMACLYARAQEGDSAVSMLQKFASNFCSVNSFHLNGDQKGGQYSNFTYRPFTLEGNFAFAQGIHELLLQSHKGYIEIFPSVPSAWKDVSFKTLRAEGAFLVSAKKENGVITEIKITSERGGELNVKLPFKTWINTGISRSLIHVEGNIATIKLKKGQTIIFKNAFE